MSEENRFQTFELTARGTSSSSSSSSSSFSHTLDSDDTPSFMSSSSSYSSSGSGSGSGGRSYSSSSNYSSYSSSSSSYSSSYLSGLSSQASALLGDLYNTGLASLGAAAAVGSSVLQSATSSQQIQSQRTVSGVGSASVPQQKRPAMAAPAVEIDIKAAGGIPFPCEIVPAKPTPQSNNRRILVVTPNFIMECVNSPNRPENILRLIKKLALEDLAALQIFNSKDNSGYFLKLAFKSGGATEYKLANAKECAEVIKSKMKSYGHPAKAAEPQAQRAAPPVHNTNNTNSNSNNSSNNTATSHSSIKNNNNGMTADMFAHRIEAMIRLFNERPSLEAIQRIMEILREATDTCPDQENDNLREVVKRAQVFLAREDVQRLLEEKKKLMPEPPPRPAVMPINNVNSYGGNGTNSSVNTTATAMPPPAPTSINASSFFSDLDDDEDEFKTSEGSFEDVRISSPPQPVAIQPEPAVIAAPSVVTRPIAPEPLFESSAPTKKNVKSLFSEDDDDEPTINTVSSIQEATKVEPTVAETPSNTLTSVGNTTSPPQKSSLVDDMDSFFGELNSIASTSVTPLKSSNPVTATPTSSGKNIDNITSEFNELMKSFGVADVSPAGKPSEFNIDDIEKIMGGHSFLDD